MRRVTILLAVLAVMALVGQAYGGKVYWDGGAGNELWCTASNWDTDTLPGDGDIATVDSRYVSNPTARITTACSVQDCNYINVGTGNGVGHVVMDDGEVRLRNYNRMLEIGYRCKPTDLSDLNTYPSFTMTGGIFEGNIRLGCSYWTDQPPLTGGLFRFEGGKLGTVGTPRSINLGDIRSTCPNDGYGVLQVIGNASGSGIKFYSYTQGAYSTLSCEIDGTAGITLIEVTGTADLDGTIEVKASGSGHSGHYVLMTYGSRTGTFTTERLPDGWSLEYDKGAGGNELWVTVPEPATLILLGIGGSLAVLRKRR